MFISVSIICHGDRAHLTNDPSARRRGHCAAGSRGLAGRTPLDRKRSFDEVRQEGSEGLNPDLRDGRFHGFPPARSSSVRPVASSLFLRSSGARYLASACAPRALPLPRMASPLLRWNVARHPPARHGRTGGGGSRRRARVRSRAAEGVEVAAASRSWRSTSCMISRRATGSHTPTVLGTLPHAGPDEAAWLRAIPRRPSPASPRSFTSPTSPCG